MKIGDKFQDEYGRKLTLDEINDDGEYIVSYYSDEHCQWVVSAFEPEELKRMEES